MIFFYKTEEKYPGRTLAWLYTGTQESELIYQCELDLPSEAFDQMVTAQILGGLCVICQPR